MKKFFFVFILIAPSVVKGGALEINEQGSVELALKNSIEIKIAKQQINAAYGKLFEGFSGFLPKVDLGVTYTKLSEPQINISGPGAAALLVAAVKEMGKTNGILLAHTHSNEVMEEKFNKSSEESVGYAAIIY